MATGDFHPKSKLEPVRIEIEVDENLKLSHVGVGYYIRLPSGQVHAGGYTWHSPRGGYAYGPSESMAKLQALVDELLEVAAEHEGVELSGVSGR